MNSLFLELLSIKGIGYFVFIVHLCLSTLGAKTRLQNLLRGCKQPFHSQNKPSEFHEIVYTDLTAGLLQKQMSKLEAGIVKEPVWIYHLHLCIKWYQKYVKWIQCCYYHHYFTAFRSVQMLFSEDRYSHYSHNATGGAGGSLITLIHCRNLHTGESICDGHKLNVSLLKKRKEPGKGIRPFEVRE